MPIYHLKVIIFIILFVLKGCLGAIEGTSYKKGDFFTQQLNVENGWSDERKWFLQGEKAHELLHYDASNDEYHLMLTSFSRFICDYDVNRLELCYMDEDLEGLTLSVAIPQQDKNIVQRFSKFHISDKFNYEKYDEAFVRKHHMIFKPGKRMRYCDDIIFELHDLDQYKIYALAVFKYGDHTFGKYYYPPLSNIANQDYLKVRVDQNNLIIERMQSHVYMVAIVIEHNKKLFVRSYPKIRFQDAAEIIYADNNRIVINVNYGNYHKFQLISKKNNFQKILMAYSSDMKQILYDHNTFRSGVVVMGTITLTMRSFLNSDTIRLVGWYYHDRKSVYYEGKAHDIRQPFSIPDNEIPNSVIDNFKGFPNQNCLALMSLDTVIGISVDEPFVPSADTLQQQPIISMNLPQEADRGKIGIDFASVIVPQIHDNIPEQINEKARQERDSHEQRIRPPIDIPLDIHPYPDVEKEYGIPNYPEENDDFAFGVADFEEIASLPKMLNFRRIVQADQRDINIPLPMVHKNIPKGRIPVGKKPKRIVRPKNPIIPKNDENDGTKPNKKPLSNKFTILICLWGSLLILILAVSGVMHFKRPRRRMVAVTL